MAKRIITVEPANPAWACLFSEEAARLRQVLGDTLLACHHMGSTAVPGLAAKPIIDILVEVRDLVRVDTLNPDLIREGYEPQGEKGIPGRRFFQKGGHQRTHHVHMFSAGDAQLTRHLAFRDYLRAHPAVRDEYGRIKLALAARHRDSPANYQAAKSQFILMHEARALAWSRKQPA